MKVTLGWRIAAIGLLCASILVAVWIGRTESVPSNTPSPSEPCSADGIWAACSADTGQPLDTLEVLYPIEGTAFPPEIAEPTFRWKDKHDDNDTWLVRIEFADGKEPIMGMTHAMQWTPTPQQWLDFTTRSVESPANVKILGVKQSAPRTLVSFGTIHISTSRDEVGSPLFYREVNLPFQKAVTDPAQYIRWRFGPVSSRGTPPVILEKLQVCGNCHSFSADGNRFGMDVDYANDKASYVMSDVSEEIVMDPGKIITWSDYHRDDGQRTRGLLSQVSPNGQYAVSTVKDRSIFVPKPDIEYSQLFFPIKGFLAIFDCKKKTFASLPGADDPQVVQSNAVWSPDGKYIAFARSRDKAYETEAMRKSNAVFSTQEEANQFLSGGRTFLYDLYRVPFNDGKGGEAEPIPGASNNGMSNYFAKYSPDGKWIVFCQAKSFMLLQPDSQLYIIPATGGEARRLQCNTNRMNSWHSWSPNSKWLVFSSKLNGPYMQLMLTHVDEEGNSTPPVLLDRFTTAERAANIPEFVNKPADAIRKICEQFMDDHSHVRVGDAFEQGGDVKNAERMYRMAIKINPRNIRARTSLAKVLFLVKQPEEAMNHLKECVKIDPEDADAHFTLGLIFDKTGNVQEAIPQYEQAVRIKPDYVQAHYNLGLAFEKTGRVREAIVHLEQAIQLDPEDAKAHFHLGVAFLDTGRVQEAIAHFERAVQLDPKYDEAHNFLGIAFVIINRIQEAIAHFERALKIKPDDAKIRGNLGRAMATADQAQTAIRQYEEAAKGAPESPDLHSKLGNALMKMGRASEAIEHFERVLQLKPDDADVHNNLAWLLATRGQGGDGNPTKAVTLARRACQLTENRSAECLDSLAAACAATGQFPEAIDTAEKAIQLATTKGQAALAKRIEIHLACYRSGHAYDESAPPVGQPVP